MTETKTETRIDNQIEKIRYIDDIKAGEAVAAAEAVQESPAEDHQLPKPEEIDPEDMNWTEVIRQGQANPQRNQKKKLGWGWIIIVIVAIFVLWLQFGVEYREGDPQGLWSSLLTLL